MPPTKQVVAVLAILLVPLAAVVVTAAYPVDPDPLLSPHAPILIDGDAAFTAANGVIGGDGTSANPFIIGGWTILANSSVYAPGIVIRNATVAFAVQDVEVTGDGGGSRGLSLRNVSSATVERVTLSRLVFGVEAESVGQLRVLNSTIDLGGFFFPTAGILALSTRDVIISRVAVSGGIFAILLSGATTALIQNSTFTHTSSDALAIRDTVNTTIVRNTLWFNNYAVSILNSTDTTMEQNRFESNNGGIRVREGRGVVVRENRIANSSEAILLEAPRQFRNPTSGLLVYHNNFMNNTQPVREDAPTAGVWDDGYPSGGNYWSSYRDKDECRGPTQLDCSNRDGIWDVPNPVGSNVDRYPLVRPHPQGATTPVARLSVSPTSGPVDAGFVFNASASDDAEDPQDLLEVRWDFDGDGTWDTNWSSEKARVHHYARSGTYSASVEVRDTGGRISQAAVSVVVSPFTLFTSILLAVGVAVPILAVLLYLVIQRRRR